jgi:hypothetical protein
VAFLGLFDLMAALAVLTCFVAAIVLILLPRLTNVRRATRVWFVVAALAGAGLFVAFNVAYFSPGDQPITPTRAQVTGTWIAASGAQLVLRPNGTFTARALSPAIGNTGTGQAPSAGHGRWVIGFDGTGSSAKSVIFTFACIPPSSACATFSLAAENHGPSGRPALFYYLGDPDDDNQYAFTRQ